MVFAVLMAIVGGVLSITPTTGAASAWADPPLELSVTTHDEAVNVAAPRWSAPEVGEAGSALPAPSAPRPRGAPASGALTTTAGDDPPPGRSPPRH